jgi:anaphase-promoting complex subunit 8
MAGEKRKDEDSEMVLGPLDGGATPNRELVGLSQGLAIWFKEHEGENATVPGSEGWLEYL